VLLSLDEHRHQDITQAYGERHPGFSPRAIRALLTRAGLTTRGCEVACREPKKPHFQVVLAVAGKASPAPLSRTRKTKAS
jgi:ArsR family transcriptional regulator